MKIRRDNYESYFLDYLDGNLEKQWVDELIDFLQKNPDLKAELQQAASGKLTPDNLIFEGKAKLIKQEYDKPEEFNKAAVAWLEGDLSEKEKKSFEAWAASGPEIQKELLLYKKTKLLPDTTVVYDNKNHLYRTGKVKTVLLLGLRIAAVFVLGFMAYRVVDDFRGNDNLVVQKVVVTENKNEKPEEAVEPKQDVKKDPAAPAPEKGSAPEKKTEKSVQPARSLRESNQGRIDHEKVAHNRVPVEAPRIIPSLPAVLRVDEVVFASLEPLKSTRIVEHEMDVNENMLADRLKEKVGLEDLSVGKVARAGLNLVVNLSGEKFTYETNKEGKVTELNYDSRLLAFSIPTNPEN